jgi:pimeloyl-ACP methyl ester carboxylesterase
MRNAPTLVTRQDAHLLRLEDVELFVDRPVGEGEPLVLIHGGWTDHTTWTRLVPPLSRSFRVIRYDRRGHTRSQRGERRLTRLGHEDDLATLIERLDIAPAHLVGTSYGALMALSLAGRRPELVRSVVAHEPPAVALVPMPDVDALFDSVREEIVSGEAAAATRRFFEDAVLGPGGWALVPEAVRQAAIANAQTYVDMLADPAWGALDLDAIARFTGPLLITYGDTGPAWLPQLATELAERLACATRQIPGAGHTPHHTHPDVLAEIIEAHALPGTSFYRT